jgi:hypothetical protein
LALDEKAMLLYRFMSLRNAMSSLQEKRLRVGRLLELNDPYDCAPGLTGGLGLSAELEEAYETQYFETAAQSLGILCFSATVSDPVIWSHYAESHRGIALGFEFEKADPSCGIFPVTYSSERRIFNMRELANLDTSKVMSRILQEGFTIKAESWRYEQEYRQFIILDGCTPSGENYFHSGPTGVINRLSCVVLGARCPIEQADITRTLRTAGYPDTIRVARAKKHRDRYEMIV